MNSFYKQKMYIHTYILTYIYMVSSYFQNSHRLLHCRQEAIRTISRRESSQRKWYWFRPLFDLGQIRISTEMVTFSQEHCMQGKYTFFYKINCSMTNVYNGYTYKEFKRNYMKFQKAVILLWNGGTSKTWSHR